MRPGSARQSRPASARLARPAPNIAAPVSSRDGEAGSASLQTSSSGSVGGGTRMQVAVRVRPFNSSDQGDTTEAVAVDPYDSRQVIVTEPNKRPRTYAFDSVFTSSQEAVFESIGRPMLEEAYNGFNVCLFAYGQTGSGKTYSVQGEDGAEAEGLVPRFVRELFRRAQQAVEGDPDLTIRVTMSYVEIYMEKVRDLLAPRHRGVEPETLDLREDPNRRVYVQDLGVYSVLGVDRVMQLIAKGNNNRQQAETKMNEFSSRSHSILQFNVLQTSESGERRDVMSDIRLVDLAGSERQWKSEASGVQLEEAKKINHSLLMLGRALNSFSEGRINEFLSLRESKLTRLLSDCFGGNSKTWMLATVAPSAFNVAESISTLDYATNAKKITSRAVVNKIARALEVKELKELVSRLEATLSSEKAKGADLERQNAILEARYRELHSQVQADGDDIKAILNEEEKEYAALIEENDVLRTEELRLMELIAAAEDAKAEAEGTQAQAATAFSGHSDLTVTYTGAAVLSLKTLLEKRCLPCTLVLSPKPSPLQVLTDAATNSATKVDPSQLPILNVCVSLTNSLTEEELVTMPRNWVGRPLVQIVLRIISVQNLPSTVTSAVDVAFWFRRQENAIMTTDLESTPNPRNATFDFRQQILMGPKCEALQDYFSQDDVLQFNVRGYSTTAG